jgi:hypothetical protein
VDCNDERIGTIKVGESEIGIYSKKANAYEETTIHREGVVKCAVCGNAMKKIFKDTTHRLSKEQKANLDKYISNTH